MGAVVGLCRIDAPGGVVIRLSEGSEIKWGAETYYSLDPSFGALAAVDALEEGQGVEVPAMQLTLLPLSISSAASLLQPGAQQSRVRVWVAEYNPYSATVSNSGDPLFDGFLDQASLVHGSEGLELRAQVVANTERLFELNIGNSLNATFHKSIWPGETGEDNATGLSRPVAWGVESPSGTYGAGTGGSAIAASRFYSGGAVQLV